MNISKHEQRVLHILAQGGAIHFKRAANGKVTEITCYTRDGTVLTGVTLELFLRLKKRKFIRSLRGKPHRATRLGVSSVRAQLDNR